MFPRGILEGIVNQGNAKVFGQKGASVETKEFSNVELNRRRRVEEKYLGLFLVTFQPRGICEGVENVKKSIDFADSGGAH